MNRFSVAAPLSVIIPALAVWLGAAWLCYANWRRSGNRRVAGKLESLRFILITLLVLTLLRPEYVQHLQRSATPEIAILTDGSDSMKTRDLVVSNTVMSRGEWLNQQLQRIFWAPLRNRAKVTVESFAVPSTNQNAINGTDLDEALENAFHRFRNLKAVLLLSDGDWNMGKSPLGAATQYREQNIPVFTVAVGRETPLPDLALEKVSAPAYGLLGEEIAIPFKVTSHLPREVKTSVSIVDESGEAASKKITIPPSDELEDAILWSPRAVGEMTETLQLPVEPDEAIADNNEQTFHISIRVEKLKVLVVDSLPRWEYRYLRNALARDPGVDLHCLLLRPDLGPTVGGNYIMTFPDSKEEMSPYDVVFLGDIGIGQDELTDHDAELLKGLVEQQGSGLVFVPGRRGRELTFLNSPLKDLYPVELDAAKPDGIGLQNESQLILTSVGKRHWLTRFDSDEDRNDELWKQLPGFFWSASVEKSRPGSEVLAVHSDLRNSWGRMPLLVTRPAGNGKVLFLGTDSAWRWRRGVEDKFHYRFWGQVVRWMAHQRHLSEKDGMRLSYSPETPEAGDTVFLQSTVLDPSGFPIDKGPVIGKVTSPGGRAERLEFAQLEGGWGVFKSSFTAQEAGKYKVEITAGPQGRRLDTELLVARPQIEKQGQPVNAQVLREIAAMTRGASVSADDLDKIINQISLLPEPQPIEQRVRLWSEPAWGGIILLLLTIYWIGRKWAGLI
ncbi:MAG: VWA domain-containing protein [Limisphaerales bacterium]